ncbi:RHS repeat-associated core domain-containing protein [Streptomyces niveus]|uniref:RHS repeat-associated core domain-containing protein n=1 Tax=Streptomyces niveus TaxID=193462 RepID=UPI0036DC6444
MGGQQSRLLRTRADPYTMGARYYDPSLGRFTQPDPSGQDTNPYIYAGGDPVNGRDPTGLFDWKSIAVTADVAVGIAGAACVAAGGVTAGLWGGATGSATAAAIGADTELAVFGGVGSGLSLFLTSDAVGQLRVSSPARK